MTTPGFEDRCRYLDEGDGLQNVKTLVISALLGRLRQP